MESLAEHPPIAPRLFSDEPLETDPRVNQSMKILCAFAITFIVAGHVIAGPFPGGLTFGYNLFPPASFHVGVFLFVAGYFYKPKHEEAPLAYLRSRVLRLLVPLYLINAAYGVGTTAAHALGFTIGQGLSAYNLLLDPLFGGHAFMFDCPLWFIAPLFLAEMVDFGLRLLLRVGGSKRKEAALIVLYLAIGLVTTTLCGREGFAEGTSSPLVLLARTGYFLPCYAFGRLYRVFLERYDTAPSWAYFGVVIAVQIIAIVASGSTYTFVVSWCQFYSGPVVPYLTTALGIAFWLRVSRILAPGLQQSPSVRWVADGTYSIMANQFLGIFAVKALFAGLAVAGLIGGFDMGAFLSDFWYYWYPQGLEGHAAAQSAFATVYVVAGIALPLGLHWVWRKLLNRARNGVA